MKKKWIWVGITVAALSAVTLWVVAQEGVRQSQAAAVWQKVGGTEISVSYSRPAVKGRRIWGELVPWGESPYPWRAGANENTTISFSTGVRIEGQPLPAGKYGLHMVPGSDRWTIIFSKVSDAWGSFSYNKANDALRVSVLPRKDTFSEWLTYEIGELTDKTATVSLRWESLRVPIEVETM